MSDEGQRIPNLFASVVLEWIGDRENELVVPADDWPHLVLFLGATDYEGVQVIELTEIATRDKLWLGKTGLPELVFKSQSDIVALAINGWAASKPGVLPAHDPHRYEVINVIFLARGRSEAYSARIMRSSSAPPRLDQWESGVENGGPLVDGLRYAVQLVGGAKRRSNPS